MLVDAVIGLQHGSDAMAQVYLRFVEQHRGREVAQRAIKTLRVYQRAPGWSDCHLWPAWGYQCKAPPKAPKTTPKAKKR